MSQQLSILPATPDDAEIAAAITSGAFDGATVEQEIEKLLGRRLSAPTWQDLKARQVRREVARSPEHCFLARAAGQVVGCVTCRVDEELSRGYVLNLAVEGPFRGRGIGRKLLLAALDHFRGLGLKQAKIEALAANPVGRGLYESIGFNEVARQVHYVMEL